MKASLLSLLLSVIAYDSGIGYVYNAVITDWEYNSVRNPSLIGQLPPRTISSIEDLPQDNTLKTRNVNDIVVETFPYREWHGDNLVLEVPSLTVALVLNKVDNVIMHYLIDDDNNLISHSPIMCSPNVEELFDTVVKQYRLDSSSVYIVDENGNYQLKGE